MQAEDGRMMGRTLSVTPRLPYEKLPAIKAAVMTDTPSPPLATFTRAGILTGGRMAMPFMLSSVIYGIAFGLMAQAIGMSSVEATLMSALVYSGTAQVAVLQAWSTTTSLIAPFVIVLVANVRYILMGAALRPWLGNLKRSQVAGPLYFLVDGGFALAMRSRAAGNPDAGVLFGACLASYFGWVAGTAIGGFTGQLITNPRAIGLDFVVISFCAAAATVMARHVKDFVPPIIAGVVIIILDRFFPGPWVIVAGGLAAALVGALRYVPAVGEVRS